MSIRWRIALAYISLILITMTGLGAYLSALMRQEYIDSLTSQLTNDALLARELIGPLLRDGSDLADLQSMVDNWAAELDTRVTVIAGDGRVLADSHGIASEMENHLDRPEIIQAAKQGRGTSTRLSETTRSYWLYVAAPVFQQGQRVAFVRFAYHLEEIQANIAALLRNLAGVALVVSILVILLAVYISDRIAHPLGELTEAVERLAQGEPDNKSLSQADTAGSRDEINLLTRRFRAMAVQLRQQIYELEAERTKINAVLNLMSAGVLLIDPEERIQLVNPAAQAMFQLVEEGVVGRSLIETLRQHHIHELWQRSRDTGEAQESLIEMRSRNLYLQATAIPLSGSLSGSVLLLIENLTRLRRLETVRQDFISNISHELRTPLASLKALTETLQDGALDDPPAAQRFLSRIEAEVDSLSQIVNELLELSRIESGRVPLKLAAVSPGELAARAVDRLRLQFERAGLAVNIDCPADIPDMLADAPRLEQVLVNLLHNALKFTPSGGGVDVMVRTEGEMVQFAVRDTGIGIPALDLPRIFERFYKADRARSSGGTGLGLAISRHLVESHGGKIWAESVEGQGSTFYFTIPQYH